MRARGEPRINTNGYEWKCLVAAQGRGFQIVGSAFEVLNDVGHGFHEKPYENALVIELAKRGIPTEQQRNFDMLYKGHKIGLYIPDLIAFNSVIVDAKVIEHITDIE